MSRKGFKGYRSASLSDTASGRDYQSLFEPVLLHSDVKPMAGLPERFRGFRLVEARALQRLLDHGALDGIQIARD